MAFRVLVVAALVAYASAGMNMEMMEMFMNMQKQQPQQQSGGCANGRCEIPVGVDVEAYMAEQKEQQKYKQEELNTKIKAQFESVMADVTMKKHRYAMGVMTEFTSMCACLKESFDVYQNMFVKSARVMNMTDIIDMDEESKKLPYQATSLKEAKERIFGGMLHAICESLGNYMTFSNLVEEQLANLNPVNG